jgi:hypothetical protein
MFAFISFLVAAQVHGQEPPKAHAAYAHLQVLEPLIGSWTMTGTSDRRYEYKLTFSWSRNKSALLGDATLRLLGGDGGQPEIPWHRLGYVWNDNTDSIEMTRLHLNSGVIEVASLKTLGNGKLRRSQIRSTAKEQVTEDTLVQISGATVTVTSTNRKNAAGEALPDKTVTLTRSK